MEILDLPIIILSLVSFSLLLYKSKSKKDISVLGASLTRLYLALVYILKFGYGQIELFHALIGTALLMIFIGDVSNTIFRLTIEKQRANLLEQKLLTANQKFLAAVEESLIPFFTIDHTGIIEYCNPALAKLLGQHKEELLGRNLIHILDPMCNSDILSLLKTDKMATCFIKTNSGRKKATIIGKETKNGHDTITGSIYL